MSNPKFYKGELLYTMVNMWSINILCIVFVIIMPYFKDNPLIIYVFVSGAIIWVLLVSKTKDRRKIKLQNYINGVPYFYKGDITISRELTQECFFGIKKICKIEDISDIERESINNFAAHMYKLELIHDKRKKNQELINREKSRN